MINNNVNNENITIKNNNRIKKQIEFIIILILYNIQLS